MTYPQHLAGLLLATLGCLAHGQILIGQTTGVTGAVAATVKETGIGAKLYLDAVNARGGVGGETIDIVTLDDKFDPKLAATNARTLVEERKVVAMFMTRGTPHTEAIIPTLEQHGVPLIAPSTGAMVLHVPVRKFVFNVRATYQREAEMAISHLASIGIQHIAILHVDDSFGLDGLEGAQRSLAGARLQATLIAKFDRNKPDFSSIAQSLSKSPVQAVMIIGSGPAVASGIRAIKAVGNKPQFVTLSNNASGGFIQLLGEDAAGVIVSQVLPKSMNVPLVREATQLAKVRNIDDLSPAMLEGFASAKVLVEALRRAGPKPTRERIQAALEGMSRFDLGGMAISYSTTNHTGLDFADLSIIGTTGKFRR
ncbi:ABC transporter substrate-binding protein [Rhodoferax sp. AJA081-3]|uniref:ABC transporter substrate-binding protein n=1 Tax=Rhodoferax sp. AJA081-3 TaxID=2752316 RepID=UPI001AE06BC0|nr:ABC transporter substrate-binding protein [Rhodoferax sp. AJA081-3]QTN27187.1 ABC transporter substrate-binding protein [Rhodoferax sp. AJA081-3]